MQIMNWNEMRNSPATRGFRTVAEGAVHVAGFSLKITFKPTFMSHAQNPDDNKLGNMAKLQFFRSMSSFYVALLSGVRFGEFSGQLNPQNLAFTLGVAFLAAGVVDMTGLGLQAVGENRE